MADSDNDVPGLDVEHEETAESRRRRSPQNEKSEEIPNFEGKVPDAELDDDSKGSLQIRWDGDEIPDSADEDEDYEYQDDEEVSEGEVGEEFAKARTEALREKREKRLAEEEQSDDEEVLEEEDVWNFPPDNYRWEEEDIGEEWADAWGGDEKTGFDPDLVDDWDEVGKLWKQGEGPPMRPYYVPYRKHYPLIPEDHPDIQTPQDVVEELDRYEEFLVWVSYIFKDGSSYEGTVYDDLAHGKGVYLTALELCRYEGEWFQNAMEGHGVLEGDVPVIEPHPDSEAAKKLRAQGKILNADFLDDEEKEWLKMDIEDKMEMGDITVDPNPFEDDEAWVKQFGGKPEKGHYRYAGQWKHSRMHGCGLYEVNGRQLYGQFYFGDLLPEKGDCNEDQVAIHSGLAEIAAAKARMFINKPDGMVREARGPYTDPSHPYMYEEDDMWMAPGFINAFHKVPEAWERYVEEVDEEREMWLNSFIKSPLRIPMPAELEYQWAHDDEFIVLSNRDSNIMHQYSENLNPEVEGDILLHTPTGQLINWAEDPEGYLRFFIQPFREDGKIRPEDVIPLPLGFDEFMGIVDEKGNPLDESRRGLSLQERKKLDDEDERKEKKEQFKAKIEELKQNSDEKIKRMQTEEYIKELERKLEDALLEESFMAELEALDQEDEDIAEEAKEIASEAEDEEPVSEDVAEFQDEQSSSSVDGTVEDDDKSQDGDNGDGADNSEAGEEADNNDDEDDKKPQSFGKVAMLVPQEPTNDNQGESTRPPFPTFASLSLVPKVALKHVLDSSIRSARRACSSQFGALLNGGPTGQQGMGCLQGGEPAPSSRSAAEDLPNFKVVNVHNFTAPKRPRITSLRLHHSSSVTKVPMGGLRQHKHMPAAQCLLSALKPNQKSLARQKAIKFTPNMKIYCRSQLQQIQRPKSLMWVLPGMEVLSMALPVQML